jgi:cobalamin biosynthesis protein CobT
MDTTSTGGKKGVSNELYGLVGPFTRIARAMSKQYNIEIVPTGTGACTDGQRIYIPFTSDFLPEEARAALNGKLDHEVAHVVEEREAREAGRSTPMEIMAGERNCTIRMLTNCYEDIRIERKAAGLYPGVAENLKSNREFNLAAMRANPERWSQFWHRLGCAIIIDTAGKGDLDWLDAATLAYFAAVSELVEEARKGIRSAAHSHDLAIRTYELVKKLRKEADEYKPPPGKKGDDGDEESAVGIGDEGLPKIDLGEAELDDLGKAGADALEKIVRDDAEANRRYIPNPANKALDRWIVAPNTQEGREEFVKIRTELASSIGGLRRKLLLIVQSRARKKIQSGLESGHLDDGQLAEVRTGNTRVFQDAVPGVFLNTAILVLLDLSGSTGERTDKNTPAYYIQRTAIALAEPFDVLNIPNCFLGWHNRTPDSPNLGLHSVYVNRSPFEFIHFKKFSERLRKVRGRFAHIYGRMDNADGEALWYSAQLLAKRPERRKILMVISDGDPLDRCDCSMLRKDLGDTIKRVVKGGIEVIGIGAGTDDPKKFYNAKTGAEFLYVQDFQKLPNDVFRLFYNKMAGVRR